MQRTLALDGVEWSAADMTFDQTGRINRAKNSTKIWAGTGGVWTGGVVSNPSGLTIAISGPLQFHANGEIGIIASPANLTVPISATSYIIAVYAETQDTPATYYGGGSPPNIHANETPTVIWRASPAVLGNGEIPLATVVTDGTHATSITDTRVILFSSDNLGNLLLGAGLTIDGMDPSAHQALVATSSQLGHVLLGGSGGATPYGTMRGAWLRDAFYDVGSSYASSKLLDDADFTSPPASSQPFVATGAAYNSQYLPTRQGDLFDSAYGPRIAARYTLTFTATGIISVALGISHWDDTIRVKANGTTLYSNTSPSGGAGQVVNFNTVNGSNTIQVYLCNGGGNQFHVNLVSNVLAQAGIVFTG